MFLTRGRCFFGTDARNLLRVKELEKARRQKLALEKKKTQARILRTAKFAKDSSRSRHIISPKAKVFHATPVEEANVSGNDFTDFKLPDEPDNPRGLDVAVVGRPNAGKSSLLNRLLNHKLSAVSRKYNTTRMNKVGYLTRDDVQLTIFDTPGLVEKKERHTFVQELVTSATESIADTDVTVLIVDAVKKIDAATEEAVSRVATEAAGKPVVLVLNKIDLVPRTTRSLVDPVSLVADKINTLIPSEKVFKISALKNEGVPELVSYLMSLAGPREWTQHSSVTSTASSVELVSEIIREKLYTRYNSELPYSFGQETRGWTTFTDGSVRIDQDVLVSADRLKRMVIGKSGSAIRAVGIEARKEISEALGCPVHLYLNVKTM